MNKSATCCRPRAASPAAKIGLADLREVQRRRERPARIIQALQSFAQKRIVAAVLRKQEDFRIPAYVRLFTRIPLIRDLSARLVAFGVRRVHVK
jgi:hypothetical protein